MKKLSTSALSSSIILASFLAGSVVKADDYIYNPSMDLSGRFSKGRKISEFNYMQQLSCTGNTLPIIDLKLKVDNKKSKEINLGLVLRHNYEDKAIFGAYAYFDRRQTASKFTVNGLTAGVEALSKYVDARANIYVPQTKRKKTSHRKTKVDMQGTSIFALSGGHTYESALRGYDVEIGAPIFAFSDKLNEKIGTK
ncbi:MAG: inverse autotransporter beta domain-containing protein, partial [Rickettsiaceae bacterium]|nr:inverse autotransporter beta domain-containing protein [Rickettsiaceae bacterium]